MPGTGVAIQFVGGPADGRVTFIPEDPMNPPLIYELLTMGDGKLLYERQPNPGDQGPLWLYNYSEEDE